MDSLRRVTPGGKSKETAQKLIQAGLDLFSTRGFHGTSIRDIAEKAGTPISNIYYHFGNKDGLMLAIIKNACKHIFDDVQEVSKRDMDPVERFKLMVRAILLGSKLYEREAKIMNFDKEYVSQECNELIKKGQRDFLAIYERELLNLQALGYIKYKNTSLLAVNTLSLISWLVRWYRPEGPLSLDEIGDESMTFILHGVFGNPTPDTDLASESSGNCYSSHQPE